MADLMIRPDSTFDALEHDGPAKPGVYALDVADGKVAWSAAAADVCNGRRFCEPSATSLALCAFRRISTTSRRQSSSARQSCSRSCSCFRAHSFGGFSPAQARAISCQHHEAWVRIVPP